MSGLPYINFLAHTVGIGPLRADMLVYVRSEVGPVSVVHTVEWPAGTVFHVEAHQVIVFIGCGEKDCEDCMRKAAEFGPERVH